MIDVNKPLREAFITALDATITYDGAAVPCYHEENYNDDESLYIVLNTQTEEDVPNKAAFFTTGTILIDVVYKSDRTSYDPVDAVADGVMQILQPTPQTHGLTDPAGLKIQWVRKLSSTPLTLNLDEEHVMRRLLRYEYMVTEL